MCCSITKSEIRRLAGGLAVSGPVRERLAEDDHSSDKRPRAFRRAQLYRDKIRISPIL